MNKFSMLKASVAPIALGLALASSPAFAQTQTPAPQTTADEVPATDIVVTGSRIASPSLTSASPLQVVDSAAIQSTGASNLQDVCCRTPFLAHPQ